jgi:hypothetical protein
VETLKLQPNRPEVIALAFQSGKSFTSTLTGDEQVMFTLMGEKRLYVDLPVAQSIEQLSLGKGEPFEITKCVDRAKKVSYEVRYLATEAQPPAGPTFEQHLRAGLVTQPPARTSVQTRPNGTASQEGVHPEQQQQHSSPAPAATNHVGGKLMSCFMSAIDAIAEAQTYATRKGLGITFTAEDVRAAAISAYITACKEGR